MIKRIIRVILFLIILSILYSMSFPVEVKQDDFYVEMVRSMVLK